MMWCIMIYYNMLQIKITLTWEIWKFNSIKTVVMNKNIVCNIQHNHNKYCTVRQTTSSCDRECLRFKIISYGIDQEIHYCNINTDTEYGDDKNWKSKLLISLQSPNQGSALFNKQNTSNMVELSAKEIIDNRESAIKRTGSSTN